MMPKIFEADGYKFFFFSNEGDPQEPCYIHARKAGSLAKFWVDPIIALASSDGFSSKELRAIERLVKDHKAQIKHGMNSLINNVRADKVWFDEDSMWIALSDGRVLAVPKIWFPRLLNATNEELADYEFSGHGTGIHWDSLDEDISVPNLLLGYRARAVHGVGDAKA